MIQTDKLQTNNFWNVREALIVQHALEVFPASLHLLFDPAFLGFLV